MMRIWFSRIWGVLTGQIPRLRAPWAWGGVAITIIAALGSAAPVPGAPGLLAWVAEHMIWFYLTILGLLVVFTAGCLLVGKDTLAYVSIKDVPGVRIRIVVGNLLSFGARQDALVVVGMNSAWDCALTTEDGSIARGSLQGQITSQWFGGSGNLEAALARRKGGHPERDSADAPVPLGQTVRLDERGKSVMWVTMARWNPAIGAYSTTVPELEQSMAGLWDGLRASHNWDEDVFCPVIGAAYGKIADESPLELLKRHIRSFVAATKEQKITETLTFVVSPKDLRDIDLTDLRDFLTAECRRETLAVHQVREAGTAKELGTEQGASFDQDLSDAARELAADMMELRDLDPADAPQPEREATIVRKIEHFISRTMRRLFSDERPLSDELYSQNVRSATECLNWQKGRVPRARQR